MPEPKLTGAALTYARRYGLFTLILLGESLLASSNAIIEAVHDTDALGPLISIAALTWLTLFVVRPIVQDLNRDHADLQVILAEPPAGERVFEEPPGSIHAGESETSRMLHVAPDLVHLDLAVSTDVPYTQSFLLYAPITRLEPSGVWGHARAATPEKGRRYYAQHVPAAVEAIRRTFAALDALAPAGGG